MPVALPRGAVMGGAAAVAVGFGLFGSGAATVPLLVTAAVFAAGGAAVSLTRLAA